LVGIIPTKTLLYQRIHINLVRIRELNLAIEMRGKYFMKKKGTRNDTLTGRKH
jgi:hypothetical protein